MSDPTDTLRARVEQAQALAAAATPGPWRSEGDTMTGGMDYRYVMVPLPVGTSVASGIIARCQRFGTHAHEAAANADLMAAAPDLAALAADLWAAYTAACDRADGRDRLEADVRRLTAERDEARKERDAALAEVARPRAAADAVPVSAGGRGLVWIEGGMGWHLSRSGRDWWTTASYSAWWDGYVTTDDALGRVTRCANLPNACRQIATWARADGHTVPPHPLGWDVGVSDG